MSSLCILEADITCIAADAVVLPANAELKEGPGASKAIFQAAGRKELQSACAKIGHVDVGSAAVTPPFRLGSGYIIHACVPKWVDGNHDEYDLLCSAYITSLKMADLLHCESIVFPLLASGNNKFDSGLAFEIATRSIQSFEGQYLKQVILTVFSDGMTKLVRSKGYPVVAIRPQKDSHVGIAGIFSNDLAEQAMHWAGDPNNIKMVLDMAKAVVDVAMPGKYARVAKGVMRAVEKNI